MVVVCKIRGHRKKKRFHTPTFLKTRTLHSPFLLYGHFHLDGLVRIVPNHFKVTVLKVVNIHLEGIDFEFGKGPGLSLELLPERIDVVQVHVGVPDCVDKVPRLATRYLSHRVGQQRVRGNVKGDAQAHVGTALVHLTRKLILFRIHLWMRCKVSM